MFIHINIRTRTKSEAYLVLLHYSLISLFNNQRILYNCVYGAEGKLLLRALGAILN